MNVTVGVILHAIGALAAASFYMPFKKIRNWSWESYWLICVFLMSVVTPVVVAWLTIPNLLEVLVRCDVRDVLVISGFGICWGIGNLTFGLALRYLGVSLGMALTLGLSASVGTILPPVISGDFYRLISEDGGRLILLGVIVCLLGIFLSGLAGMSKEKELSEEQKQQFIKEFNLRKGVAMALVSGITSAGIAFGILAGTHVTELTEGFGAGTIWKNGLVLIFIMAGGFVTNGGYCLYLNIKNGSARDYVKKGDHSIAANYFLAATAGVVAFMEFMFYGMGTTRMGKNDFISFSIHLSMVIVISTTWGFISKEWKGSSKRTLMLMFAGIAVLILSTTIMAFGNHLTQT